MTSIWSPERWRSALAKRRDLLLRPQDAEVMAAGHRPAPPSVAFNPTGRDGALKVLLAYFHYDYGQPRRGISYETTAFRDPLIHLGCEVIDAPIDVFTRRYGSSGANAALLELAFRHDPDLLFVIPSRQEIALETLTEVRDRLGIPVLVWFCDDQWRFDNYTRGFLPHISVAATTSADSVAKYHAVRFEAVIHSQFSANHRIFRPLNLPLIYDCSFVGQPYGGRRRLVERLRREGVQVVARGTGWPEGRATLREMVEIHNQSKICLNFSTTSGASSAQVKGRDFEIPATGRPMLSGRSHELDDYFAEGEVVTYVSEEDLVERATELLANPDRREAVAAAGLARVLRDHTAEKRLGDLINNCVANGYIA